MNSHVVGNSQCLGTCIWYWQCVFTRIGLIMNLCFQYLVQCLIGVWRWHHSSLRIGDVWFNVWVSNSIFGGWKHSFDNVWNLHVIIDSMFAFTNLLFTTLFPLWNSACNYTMYDVVQGHHIFLLIAHRSPYTDWFIVWSVNLMACLYKYAGWSTLQDKGRRYYYLILVAYKRKNGGYYEVNQQLWNYNQEFIWHVTCRIM